MNEKVNKIKAHLAEDANNVIVLRTALHNTVYKPKHADMFLREDANGVFVKSGKKTIYYFAYQVAFASYKKAVS